MKRLQSWLRLGFPLGATVMLVGACDATPRPPQSEASADLRSMAAAIESYRIDNNVYPAWTDDPAQSINAFALAEDPDLKNVPGFLLGGQLTTPIAYLIDYPADRYAKSVKAPPDTPRDRPPDSLLSKLLGPSRHPDTTKPTFAYWTPPAEIGQGYLVWSAGPDSDYDLTLKNVAEAYGSDGTSITARLSSLTYDPTNGSVSNGDLWRIGPVKAAAGESTTHTQSNLSP